MGAVLRVSAQRRGVKSERREGRREREIIRLNHTLTAELLEILRKKQKTKQHQRELAELGLLLLILFSADLSQVIAKSP